MARLAFVSPLPPAATGIADYSAEVLHALAASGHELDAVHAQPEVEGPRLPAGCGVLRAEELLSRHRERPYDLAIHQLGNGPAHGFLYELLPRLPGLLVLHDLVLHHARARAFLESEAALAYARDPSSSALRDEAERSLDGYRAEAAYSYPAQAGRLAEAHLGTVGQLLPYAYPLFRLPVEASRAVAVHNEFMAAAVREEVPGSAVVRIPMGVERVPVRREAVHALRERLGLRPDECVVGSFGLLTREKQAATVARAVARAESRGAAVRLMLVGPVPDPGALEALLSRLGPRRPAVVTGRVPFADLPLHIEAADVVAHLRYPTARETSAALLRVLAQGRPTVISDLEHLADIPKSAVLRADPRDEEGDLTRAILRLAADMQARDSLSRAAAAFAASEHSPARCRDGYESAIALALARPSPASRPGWPAHWRDSAVTP